MRRWTAEGLQRLHSVLDSPTPSSGAPSRPASLPSCPSHPPPVPPAASSPHPAPAPRCPRSAPGCLWPPPLTRRSTLPQSLGPPLRRQWAGSGRPDPSGRRRRRRQAEAATKPSTCPSHPGVQLADAAAAGAAASLMPEGCCQGAAATSVVGCQCCEALAAPAQSGLHSCSCKPCCQTCL